jgi:hypothetical protein
MVNSRRPVPPPNVRFSCESSSPPDFRNVPLLLDVRAGRSRSRPRISIGYDHAAALGPNKVGLCRLLKNCSDVPGFQRRRLPSLSTPGYWTHDLMIRQGCPLGQMSIHLLQRTEVVDCQPDILGVIARFGRTEMLRVGHFDVA